jgi:hypothetical protein
MHVSTFVTQTADLDALASAATQAVLRPRQLEHDIVWLAHADHGAETVPGALAFHRGSELAGYAPLRCRKKRLVLRLGEVGVASLPHRSIQLFGQALLGGDDELAGTFIEQLGKLPYAFDAATIEQLPVTSPVWRVITRQRGSWYVPIEQGRGLHRVVELAPTMADYLARFSTKTRGELRRKTKRLTEDLGPLELSLFTRPTEVRSFLDIIDPVVRKTYQHRLLGKSPAGTGDDSAAHNLEVCARHGWLRAYVLMAGKRPIAYELAYAAGRTLQGEMTGYDPECMKYGPGIVLMLRVIEDLIESEAFDRFDFGSGDASYKELLSTTSYEEVKMVLLRRTLYARGVSALERGFASASRLGVNVAERVGAKDKLKAMIRRAAR